MIFIAGCSVDPVTGAMNLNFYSEADEIRLGEQYHPVLMSQYGEYKNKYLKQYLQSIVDQLAEVSHRPRLNYSVDVLDTPMVNAFAVPGGHVYVCRGLFPYLNSEAELAAVLAHELGHVNARHSVEQQSNQRFIGIGLSLGTLFFDNKQQAQTFYEIGSGLSTLSYFSYSRDNEMEADRLAIEYSHRAGFSALGTGLVMRTFERLAAGYDKNNPMMTLLSTHPVSDVRSKQARIEVRKLQDEEFIKKDLDRNRYLGAIDGLYLGNSLLQGTVLEGTYFNTSYNIKIDIPKDFQTFTEVQNYLFVMQKQDKSRAAYFKIIDKGRVSLQQAADQFADQVVKALPIQKAELKWNGKSGLMYAYGLGEEGDLSQLTHALIEYGDHLIEVIFLESRDERLADLKWSRSVVEQLQILPLSEARGLEQERLEIYAVKPGDSWHSLAKKFFSAEDAQKLAWANGCELSDPLPEYLKLFLF